ncbi:MAG: hypothetical protein GX591_01490 [Planctomycetes bacterium]|nr:hypothetical protein [Planctomycetota bacterium]
MPSIADYYQDPHVRRQMLRFLGGDSLAETTAAYLTASDPGRLQFDPQPIEQFDHYLEQGLDIGRSLWDRRVLLAHLDIDYVNFTFPAEPHIHPRRTFGLLAPVVDAARELLAAFGIRPLHLLSGCGHHLVWAVRQDGPTFALLAELGRLPPSLAGRYRQRYWPPGWRIAPQLGRAWDALGLLLEYVCHRILHRARSVRGVPVEATAVRVGEGRRGAELLSLDISEYADPLHLRTIRVPFSVYLKCQQRRDVLGADLVARMPEMFLIPLGDGQADEALATRDSLQRARALAAASDTTIPDASKGTAALVEAYRGSELAAFHAQFYDETPEPPGRWPQTYDRFDAAALPPCGRRVLEHPCDLLMQPGLIRHVVRLLLASDWHPRHVAGLIRSKYERDHGWGGYWYHYDATSRAEFYTRLFAGLLAAGLDDLADFTCPATGARGDCRQDGCSGAVDSLRAGLLERRTAHV